MQPEIIARVTRRLASARFVFSGIRTRQQPNALSGGVWPNMGYSEGSCLRGAGAPVLPLERAIWAKCRSMRAM